jgi:hypothetical protein
VYSKGRRFDQEMAGSAAILASTANAAESRMEMASAMTARAKRDPVDCPLIATLHEPGAEANALDRNSRLRSR